MTGAGLPTLSVVLMVDSQRARGGWALASVLSQEFSGRLEVLIFDFGHAEHPPLAGSDHRDVRVIPALRGGGYGETMAAAVSAARAPVIAFIEEHVVVLEGWADAIQRAYEGLFRRLRADGHRLAVEPDARIVHAHEYTWSGFLAGSVQSSRLATASALEVGGRRLGSTVRAVVAALAGPVRWPFVLLRRTRDLPESDVWLPRLRCHVSPRYRPSVTSLGSCSLATDCGPQPNRSSRGRAASTTPAPALDGRVL